LVNSGFERNFGACIVSSRASANSSACSVVER
jgi:hypothetical protein